MSSILYTVSNNTVIRDYEYTKRASHDINAVVSSSDFRTKSPEAILTFLTEKMYRVSFGDYLKRYLYEHFGLRKPYSACTMEDFSRLIADSFRENDVPFSFEPTTRKPSATIRKWLTQYSVRRQVVFLLGFGLKMSCRDVEDFLTKVLNESSFNMIDYKEVIYQFCFRNSLSFHKAGELIRGYETSGSGSSDTMDQSGSPAGFRIGKMETEKELNNYLRFLKYQVRYEQKKAAARSAFERLLIQTAFLIAQEREASRMDHLNAGISSGRTEQVDPSSISYQMIEETLYSGISPTEDGNLRPMDDSSLSETFQRYRLTRQRINGIMKKKVPADRFDLITLLFYIYAQKDTESSDLRARKEQCLSFIDEMNEILVSSGMGKLHPVNPYESFLLLCLLSLDPWESFCEVWSRSYGDNEWE